MTRQEKFKEHMKTPRFKEWYDTRPKKVQLLARRFPFERYRIKKGAPYGISCGGTLVDLVALRESGQVTIIVRAKDKLPAAIEHENMLFMKYQHLHPGKKPKDFFDKDVKVVIDAKWLEQID